LCLLAALQKFLSNTFHLCSHSGLVAIERYPKNPLTPENNEEGGDIPSPFMSPSLRQMGKKDGSLVRSGFPVPGGEGESGIHFLPSFPPPFCETQIDPHLAEESPVSPLLSISPTSLSPSR